jgi:HEAT repeat protein
MNDIKTLVLGGVLAMTGCTQAEPASLNGGSRVVTIPKDATAKDAAKKDGTADSVDALLNAYEGEAGNVEVWKRLGPPARTRLREVLENEQEGVTRRARAAESLGFLSQGDDPDLLTRMAANTGNDRIIRMGALTGLTIAQGPRAVKLLTGYLDDAEPGVRSRAIELLGSLKTPEAKASLEAQLKTAPDGEKAKIQRALESAK